MLTIIHGNDTAASRAFYIETRQKINNPEVFEGDKLNYDLLFKALEGNSLFETEKHIFIENFFGSVKTNSLEFKKIADYLNSKKDINLFFWEGKELTKTQSLAFKNSIVKVFNYPQLLFNFLDELKPNNPKLISLFNKLQVTMETELIFYMIIRQFRIMLSLIELNDEKIDEARRIAPWQVSKLKAQAKYFDKQRLKEIYKKLYTIDYETKFGLNSLDLAKTIDIFLIDL